jgi:hypothetical protein
LLLRVLPPRPGLAIVTSCPDFLNVTETGKVPLSRLPVALWNSTTSLSDSSNYNVILDPPSISFV